MQRITVAILCLLLIPICSLAGEWTLLGSGIPDNMYALHFLDAQNGYAVGWGANPGTMVLKTANGGDSWTSTMLSSNSYTFSITFTDAQTGFIAGCLNGGSSAAIWRTTNGGGSWIPSSFATSWGFYAVDFPSHDIGYTCGWNGKIYKTINGGDSWTPQSSSTGNVFRYLDCPDDTHGFALCGTNYNNSSMIYRTTNGTTWSLVKNFGAGTVLGGVHFFDNLTGIVVGRAGTETVLKTYDGGLNWEIKHTGPTGLALQGLHFEGSNGIAVGSAGRILLSDDGGETWILDHTTTPVTTLLAAALKDGAAYAAGTSGRIFKRDDVTVVPEVPTFGAPLKLLPNHPNPFNPSTRIEFELGHAGDVRLEVLGASGRLVRLLLDEPKSRGHHGVTWDGLDSRGRSLPSGIYLCRLSSSDGEDCRKLSLLK